jgi:hypothetical protein
VPVDLASTTADGIRLDCTMAEFEALGPAEETQFVPGTRGYDLYGPEQVLSWPYYQLGDTVMFPEDEGKFSQTVTTDTVPLGEVAVPRGAHVHATDGPIGQVQGLVIDPSSDHVTHVLGPQAGRHPDQRGDAARRRYRREPVQARGRRAAARQHRP